MKILVATDLSAPADEAIRQAHATAGESGTLAVCHVVPNLQPIAMLFPQSTQANIVDVAGFTVRAEVAVRERVSELTGRATDSFEVFVVQGVDYAAIVECAETWRADLVVVGTHGGTALERLFLGSVAARVTRYAHCPVLVAREGALDGPVIAATDLSDPSLPALSAGRDHALRRKASLVGLHVVELVGAASYLSAAGAPFGIMPTSYTAESIAQLVDVGKRVLSGAMESVQANGEALAVAGDAESVIVDTAKERRAQLLVVGTRGRTGLERVALGSVAEKLVSHAPCSVLVVRLHDTP